MSVGRRVVRAAGALALGATAALLLVSSITSSGNVELEYKWKGCVCCVCVSERCEG